MLNENGKRALAYVVQVIDVEDIIGADNIQKAKVNGWSIIIKKDEFKNNDLGIFFEIDSLVPSDNPVFDFLASKKYRIKTMKLNRFGVLSQGLVNATDFFPRTWEY